MKSEVLIKTTCSIMMPMKSRRYGNIYQLIEQTIINRVLMVFTSRWKHDAWNDTGAVLFSSQ